MLVASKFCEELEEANAFEVAERETVDKCSFGGE